MDSSLEAQFKRAFELAFFFHPERGTALGIAARALGKLRVAERTQVRRTYYRPIGRRLRHGSLLRSRTKVSVERAQLLQRLVLHESEVLERDEETRGGPGVLTDEEFTLRFVKQLVRSAMRRNSLYVAVGVGRILHSYSTAEVQNLLSTVVQDPERVPEDSYVRHVKASLTRELAERFGAVLRTRVGARGEESFEAATPSPRQRRLVGDCLELLTPWNTACAVPAGFDAMRETLQSLRFMGGNPDEEHEIEVNRMHSLIHPDCFSRLTAASRLAPPAERLSLPRPFRSSDTEGGPEHANADRTSPPALAKEDLEDLPFELSGEAGACEPSPAERLDVRVDGIRRLALDTEPGAAAGCVLSEGAELIEVWGSASGGTETLLGVHELRLGPLLPNREQRHEWLRIDLGGGRELWLHLITAVEDAGRPRVELAAECRATSLATRLAAVGRGLGTDAGRGTRLIPAAGAVLGAAALLLLLLAREPLPFDVPPEAERSTGAASSREEQTRGSPRAPRGATLASARLVYLVPIEGHDADEVMELVRLALEESGQFEPTTDREQADVALKVRTIDGVQLPGGGDPGVGLRLELVDERGAALWSGGGAAASWGQAAEEAVGELVRQTR